MYVCEVAILSNDCCTITCTLVQYNDSFYNTTVCWCIDQRGSLFVQCTYM